MKKFSIALLAMILVLMLTGCSCKHEWAAADCVNPPTCGKCGVTEGEPLGHEWTDATCTAARSCERCGRSEGEPLGHTWTEATCAEPKTCTTCGEILGEALSHVWTEATTEAPATCSLCGITEGEKIATDARFVTAEAQPFFGSWYSEISVAGEDLGLEGFEGKLEGAWVTTFDETGSMVTTFETYDEAALRKSAEDYLLDRMAKSFEDAGLDQEEADTAAKILVFCTVEEYIHQELEAMTLSELMDMLMYMVAGADGDVCGEYVYYVEGDQLYMGDDWESEMYAVPYEFLGSKLIIAEYMQYSPLDVEQ